MIAAQVALNYGLFCRDIVFNGLFDKTDRRFLREMAENTAREIFVNKFLAPNPFLVGEAARLPAVKPKAFLQAKLTFPEGCAPMVCVPGRPIRTATAFSPAAARTACWVLACSRIWAGTCIPFSSTNRAGTGLRP
jgi:hypothetical protein